MDIKYNYLIEDSMDNFPNDFNVDERIDPDSCSKKLYDDIISVFFKSIGAQNLEQQFALKPKFYTVKLKEGVLLSADYIGPSVYWAREVGITENEIREYLKLSRTIGGHILWERGDHLKYKVNPSRGGCSGVYDRFDWTLLLLKIYLFNTNQKLNTFVLEANKLIDEEFRNKKNLNDKFEKLFNAFSCSNWLKKFTFEKFCLEFKLVGSFVNSNYEIIEAAPLFPVLPCDYRAYITKVCEMIELRNKSIFNKSKTKIQEHKEIYLESDEYLLNKDKYPYAYECLKCNRIITNEQNYSVPPICDECASSD